MYFTLHGAFILLQSYNRRAFMDGLKYCPDCKTNKERVLFGKERANRDGLRSICKMCNSQRALKWHNKNRDHVNAREREAHKKDPSKNRIKNNKWIKNNPDKVFAINKRKWAERDPEKVKMKHAEWRQENKDRVSECSKRSYEKNKEKVKNTHKKWEQNNKGKRRSIVAKRRAIKIRATPSYLTEEDFKKIEAFYVLAHKKTEETGIPYEVDHILPLNGEIVSGFHHWNNLQVLTAEQNRTKGNKIMPHIIGLFPEGFDLF